MYLVDDLLKAALPISIINWVKNVFSYLTYHGISVSICNQIVSLYWTPRSPFYRGILMPLSGRFFFFFNLHYHYSSTRYLRCKIPLSCFIYRPIISSFYNKNPSYIYTCYPDLIVKKCPNTSRRFHSCCADY